jgi:CheY-like chemotaxis protein
MSRPKILAIDDSSTDIDLLRFALDRQGEEYELEVLQDGAEALQFIREHRTGTREPEPCVIVLDIHLPMHDGMEVLKAVRLEPALTHIQVVVLSTFLSTEKRAEVEQSGAVYRIKPSTLTELLDLAAEILTLCKQAVTA